MSSQMWSVRNAHSVAVHPSSSVEYSSSTGQPKCSAIAERCSGDDVSELTLMSARPSARADGASSIAAISSSRDG